MINKILQFIRPFAIVVCCALGAMLLMRFAELGYLFILTNFAVPLVVVRGLLSMLMCLGVATTVLLPIYALLAYWRQRLATAVSAALFGLLIFAEAGLTAIAQRRGLPIGSELIMRPTNEVLHTLSSVMPVWVAVVLCVGAIGAFTCVCLWATRLRLPRWLTTGVLLLLLLTAPIAPKAKKLTTNITKPKISNYIENKTLFFIRSCLHTSKVHEHNYKFELDRSMLEQFLHDNPGLQPLDSLYPLERASSSIPDVLSPYFAPLLDGQMPNIVIVVAESLGREWSGDNEMGVSFTPFLDSLARHALHWPNCISTSTRSFGAVPAITGSVPPGPRGFQFGIMPQHNSLISLLRSNGYRANAFYAYDFNSDALRKYLQAQSTDYLSDHFLQEALNSGNPNLYLNMGFYHDPYLFTRSLEELERIDSLHTPLLNIFITASAHDDLKLYSQEEQHKYLQQTQNIINQLPNNKRTHAQQHLNDKASLLYSDHALRELFRLYSQRPDFERTIFVITGDHSRGVQIKNPLGYHHVPLIIWSPLLTRPALHQPLVTHLDIAPSLAALLHGRYGMPLPATAQWASNGLSIGKHFEAQRRMLLLTYEREINRMIYDNYLYISDNNAAYTITPALELQPITNEKLKDSLYNKLLIYKHINNYIYYTNHLTQHPVVPSIYYEPLLRHSVDSLILNIDPQIHKTDYPDTLRILLSNVAQDGIKNLRIELSAQIMMEGIPHQVGQMRLIIGCHGENIKSPSIYDSHIGHSLHERPINMEPSQWYNLNVLYEFDITNAKNIGVQASIAFPSDSYCYSADNTLHLKDIYITVEGSR